MAAQKRQQAAKTANGQTLAALSKCDEYISADVPSITGTANCASFDERLSKPNFHSFTYEI
jgi:hypothetical protein